MRRNLVITCDKEIMPDLQYEAQLSGGKSTTSTDPRSSTYAVLRPSDGTNHSRRPPHMNIGQLSSKIFSLVSENKYENEGQGQGQGQRQGQGHFYKNCCVLGAPFLLHAISLQALALGDSTMDFCSHVSNYLSHINGLEIKLHHRDQVSRSYEVSVSVFVLV